MTYNSQRDQLTLRQYGRTIQDMVAYCKTLDSRAQRQRCAEAIIGVMASMNPQVRQLPNYQQRLWEQLAAMADYELDIDFPCTIERPEEGDSHPAPLKYPMQRIHFRHYGHLVEASMRKLQQIEDEEKERKEAEKLRKAEERAAKKRNNG